MEEKSQGEGDFSAVLGTILSNPDMMSTIRSMAEKLKSEPAPAEPPAEDTLAKPEDTEPSSEAKAPDAISALAPLLSADFSKLSRGDDKRACLLRALKPYLSESRCEAIEYIIKFSALSEVIKKLS